jgi:hypothetical protein
MKRISVMIAVAMAALSCAALAVASTAFAEKVNVLCKTSELPCKSANVYPEGTKFTAETTESTGPFKISTTSGVNIECPSRIEATVGAGSTKGRHLSVSSWTLGDIQHPCNSNFGIDTCGGREAEGLPYAAEASAYWWSEENPPEGEEISVPGVRWHMICRIGGGNVGQTFVECTYGGPLTPFFGEDHQSLEISEQEIDPVSGSGCVGNGFVHITLKVVEPKTPVYVSWTESTTATALCKTSPTESRCGAENRYPAKTAIEAELSKQLLIASGSVNVECASHLKATSSSESGTPLGLTVEDLSFSSCSGGGGSCTVASEEKGAGTLAWTAGSNGEIGYEGLRIHVNCTGFINCRYYFPSLTLEGGSPAHLSAKETSLVKQSGSLCPAGTTTLKPATYTVTSPKPLYVALAGT